ncbi:MAG: LppX_LprAFG lipoprotein [Chloroflexi bacterium]|nr:LppX_LprAFG lipoprotein [Chloroflexota bacterium]
MTPALRAALVALAVMSAALALSCFGGDEEPAPPATPTAAQATATPEPTPTPVDPAAVIRESADRMEGVQQMHFRLDHENGASEIVRGIMMVYAEGDIGGADRMRAEIEGALGTVKFETGVIILPEGSWIQNPFDRSWEREDISIEEFFDPQDGVAALMREVLEPVLEGIEEVGGVETYRIEVLADSGDLAVFPTATPGFEVRATLWIGVEDLLLYRVDVRGAISEDESSGILRRLELSRFGEDVDIAPPP